MINANSIKFCGAAILLGIGLLCVNVLTRYSSTNTALASEYPATSVVEIQPPGLFPYGQSSSGQSIPVSASSGLQPISANTAQPPLQISGQAYLAAPLAKSEELSPELEQPIGVHVVDSPEGKVII